MMPEENVAVLRRMMRFCVALVGQQAVNKMSSQNVAIVIAPSLM